MSRFEKFFNEKKPAVIGMIHVPALPGSPKSQWSMAEIIKWCIQDALNLEAGGVSSLMIENFGDIPFAGGRVEAHTVSSLTVIAQEIKQAVKIPIGINVLRNDGLSALSIAKAVGASFIRVNILAGARITDQGIIQSQAYDLMRLRKFLDCDEIKILADVDVKHSARLGDMSLSQEVSDTIERSLADAVIVSGDGTGKEVDLEKLELVSKCVKGRVPVLIGSGVTAENVGALAQYAQGFIVGSSLKENGMVANAVDKSRVRLFMKKVQSH